MKEDVISEVIAVRDGVKYIVAQTIINRDGILGFEDCRGNMLLEDGDTVWDNGVAETVYVEHFDIFFSEEEFEIEKRRREERRKKEEERREREEERRKREEERAQKQEQERNENDAAFAGMELEELEKEYNGTKDRERRKAIRPYLADALKDRIAKAETPFESAILESKLRDVR